MVEKELSTTGLSRAEQKADRKSSRSMSSYSVTSVTGLLSTQCCYLRRLTSDRITSLRRHEGYNGKPQRKLEVLGSERRVRSPGGEGLNKKMLLLVALWEM